MNEGGREEDTQPRNKKHRNSNNNQKLSKITMRVMLQVTHFIFKSVWIVVGFLAVFFYVRATALSRLLCVKSFEHGIRVLEPQYTPFYETYSFFFTYICVLCCVFFSSLLSLLSFVVREKLTCHKFLLRNPNEQIVSTLECACIKAKPEKNETKITMCIIVLWYLLIWRHRRHFISSTVSYFPTN